MIPLGVLASARAEAAGGAFSPADIAGLTLWLDSSAITGLASGDPVTSWADLSGSGNHVTQGTATAQPTYSTELGVGSVLFDGSDWLATTGHLASVATRTGFVVATVSDNSTRTTLGTSGTVTFALDFTNRQVRAREWGAASTTDTVAVPAGTLTATGGSLDGTTVTVWRDGRTPFATNRTASTSANRTIRIGAKGTAEYHLGHICEVLNYEAILSESDRLAVQSYLMTKWGIA